MTEVIIDGTKYVPACDTPPLTDQRLQQCLEVLTEMRYFKQNHKMEGLAWEAMNALSPDLAEMEVDAAYNLIHGYELWTNTHI